MTTIEKQAAVKLRLLVAEAEAKASDSARAALVLEGYHVDVAVEAGEVLRLAKLSSYDAIVLDVTVPSLSGLAVVGELRQAGITAPLLILSAQRDAEERVRGLDAGADDYLSKPVTMAELLARLRALLRRLHAKSPKVLRVADLQLDRVTRQATRSGESVERIGLTPREFALLELLMSASPKPVSKAAIIEQVWGLSRGSKTNLVNVYVRSLRRKLDRKPWQPLLHTVRGVGFSCRQL